MVNCNAVYRGNKAARRIFHTIPLDKPLGVQLYGSKPEKILQTAKEIPIVHDGMFLDINFSCPDREILNQGAGAALLRRPTRMKEIISLLVKEQYLPVTAKIRLQSLDFSKVVKTAILLEEAGISAITVHARTIKQKNSGKAYWEAIREVKKAVKVPVIGNGGVYESAKQFARMLSFTGCDAVMIGKAAIYNPGLFSNIENETSWLVFSQDKRLSWLQTYLDYARKQNLLKLDRFLERAKDFLRTLIHVNRITYLFYQAKDPDIFLQFCDKEINLRD
jgi:tRNA-dihydrouridine synthase B